jgi:RimJ/RimL family protein N-acetyltransferase
VSGSPYVFAAPVIVPTAGAQPTITLKSYDECTKEERSRFHIIVVDARAVRAEGLDDRMKRAAALVFLKLDSEIIGVGALKRQRPKYTADIFNKANAKSAASNYGLELGWVVVSEDHRGRNYSPLIAEALVAHAANKPVYATCLSTNKPMHKTLMKHQFKRDGGEWPSTEHKGENLILFVRN